MGELLFATVGLEAPSGSLLDITGDRSLLRAAEAYPSGTIMRVADAWRTPLREMTFDQARALVSQEMGLEWLVRPVALFVRRFPDAETALYPGDLTLAALRAFPAFAAAAPSESAEMLDADFERLFDRLDFDPALRDEAKALVSAARQRG